MTDSPRLRRMKDAVSALYARNRQRGKAAWCGHEYDFVCPSTGTYPFQWFWDSCFHTVALSHVDPARARSEVRSLLKNAQPDGFVAHVTFWQREAYEEMLKTYSIAYRTPYLSDCMQPPVLAEAVAAAAQGEGGRAFLAEILPTVRRYFDWLDRVRDPDRDGLIATLQPDESGLDHTPKYDEYLGITGTDLEDFTAAWDRVAGPYAEVGRDPQRMFALDRFVVEDCFVNAIYGENQRVLGDLLERVGDAAGAAEMTYRNFIIYNVFGGLLWVVSMLSAGYFLGGLVEQFVRNVFGIEGFLLEEHIDKVVIVVVLLSILPIIVEFIKARRQRKSPELADPIETADTAG